MKKALFHIHTHYSYDCLTSPIAIVKKAISLGIDYLVISDHNSINGSLEARFYATTHQLPIEIPIAAEYFTDIGDVVVVNVSTEFIPSHDHRILCQSAKEDGGYTIIPHPYDGHDLENIDYTHVDAIEAFNSRSSPNNNEKSALLVARLNKIPMYGSDAHFLKDIERCIIGYEGIDPFIGKSSSLKLTHSSWQSKLFSQYIKAWKHKDSRLALQTTKRFIKKSIVKS